MSTEDTTTITFRTTLKNKEKAKRHAKARGISVSQLCDELLELLPEKPPKQPRLMIGYTNQDESDGVFNEERDH
jgi:hypothetical protein